MNPLTLADLRRDIDALDSQLIGLLARRQRLVEQAGRLKPRGDQQAVAAPERVAQVIADRRRQAQAVWRAMIDAFIQLESQVNQWQ